MRAALVSARGRPPVPGERPDPAPGDGEVEVEVLAVPLNPVDIAVAAGKFYGGHPDLPFLPGAEAVGRAGGRLVWVNGGGLGVARDGTLGERVVVGEELLTPVPEDADPALAGALGIAGLAAWLPLVRRAPVRKDDVVLVLGATGTVGSIACQVARLLGAAHVVAAGRDVDALRRAEEWGADASVQLDEGDLAAAFRSAAGDDGPTYVFDPLCGAPLEAAAEAAAPGARIVQLGQSAGPAATLSSAIIRGKQLDILGYSSFAVPRDVIREEYPRLVGEAIAGRIQVDLERVPLDRVAEAWERQAGGESKKLVVEI